MKSDKELLVALCDTDGDGLTVDADVDEAIELLKKGSINDCLDRMHTVSCRAKDLLSFIRSNEEAIRRHYGKQDYKPQFLG